MRGQALVESLFTYILIFLLSFSVIEVARLQSFKALLQISVNYYAKYLALNEMHLIKQKILNLNSNKVESTQSVEDEIKQFIAKDLGLLETSLVSFSEKTIKLIQHNVRVNIDFIVRESSKSPPGVHIKAQTCLPLLFSSFFGLFLPSQKIKVGRSVNGNFENKNCFGEFSFLKETPRFWFRVRAASYSAWPSSTQIFYRGLAVPDKIPMIDAKNRINFLKKLDEVNFENLKE